MIKERMERALLVCRAEWAPLMWLFLLNFMLYAVGTLGFCVVNALYMHAIVKFNFGLQVFPLAFIITALILIPFFIVYNHLERKVERKMLLSVSFLIYGALGLFFRYLLSINPHDYYLLLTVFVLSTCIILILNLQFWSFANRIFHPRQGKRLFPLLGTGGILGAIIMGFSLAPLLKIFNGSINLFYLWALIFALAALVVVLMYNFLKIKTSKEQGPKEQKKEKSFYLSLVEDFRIIEKLPILRIIALVIMIMSFISFIIYFKFNHQLALSFPDQGDFVSFLGHFNGLLNLTILFYQLFLTGRLISGLGIINSLYLQPGMLFVPLVAMFFTKSPQIPILIARFVDELGQETFFRTASESIYGAVPGRLREQAMSFIKIIVTPLSVGLSSLVLLILFKSLFDLTMLVTNILLPILLVVWGYFVWKLKDLYVETLFGNFVSGSHDSRLESFRALSQLKGARTLDLMQRTLKHGSEKMKKFALELAGEMRMVNLKEDILEFLTSNDQELKAQAISSLGLIGGTDLYPELMKIYKKQNTTTKMIILQNLQLIDSWNFEINAPLLVKEEKDPAVQGYLLEYIWSRKELLTEQKDIFRHLIESEDPKIRMTAAHCLRYDRDKTFEKDLLELMEDEDEAVSREALESAGELRLKSAIPKLLKFLESPAAGLSEAAARSLIRIKVNVAKEVIAGLNFNEPMELLARRLKIIASAGDAEDQLFLLQSIYEAVPEAAVPALEIFARNLPDYRSFSHQEKAAIKGFISDKALQMRDEFKAAYALRKGFKDYHDPSIILMMLLKERIDTLRRIILLGLHLLFRQEKILTIMENIFSGDVRRKNIAVEALENLLPVNYRKLIIPLFEKDDLVEEMEYIVDLYNLESDDYGEMLDIISRYGDSWMKAWAFYTAGLLKMDSWKPLMEEAVDSDDRLLAEHAKVGIKLLESEEKPPAELEKEEKTDRTD